MSKTMLALVIIAVFGLGMAISETYTMETYYPSPVGVYTNMTVTSTAVLARDGGNVGIGTTSPKTPSPNRATGNLDANDVYLRSTGRWVSSGGNFGGLYTKNLDGTCRWTNPFTSGCSCPAGFSASLFSRYWSSNDGHNNPTFPYCDGGTRTICGIASYQCVRL